MPLLQKLIRRFAAMHPGLVTAYITAAAVVLAVPIGLFVWQIIVRAGLPILGLMIGITAVIVAVPLAGFLALALAWGWQRQLELRRNENDLRCALERAEVANRAKSEFLASMSHELRTPLNAILGFSEMIRDERLGPLAHSRYGEYAADIHDSGAHLLALIDGLLDVAKIEAGRHELREEKLDLNAVVERAVRTVQPVAARKAQRIEPDLPKPALIVRADEKALHQILLNLLSNAIKFSHARGVIAVRVARTADKLAIMVEDHGIGIPDDKLAHVGKPFFQAHGSTASIAGGTGIGLSVTLALVERLGGTLSIASRYGEGTCVTVGLPVSRLLPSAGTAA